MNKNAFVLFATVMAFGICIACINVYAGGDQQRIHVFGPGFDDSTTTTPTSRKQHSQLFDDESGELVLTGIPILISNNTRILPAVIDIDSIEPGLQAVARVGLVDTDDDELVDSLFATKINVYTR